ncbi:hypothetical protein HK405_008639, partial [Cladochytrium tenue]
APWYAYLGGLLGSFYVVSLSSLVARLGAARFFLVSVVFQLAGAAVLDALGAAGLDRRTPSAGRIAGLVAVVAGCVAVTADGLVGARRAARQLVGDTDSGGQVQIPQFATETEAPEPSIHIDGPGDPKEGKITNEPNLLVL